MVETAGSAPIRVHALGSSLGRLEEIGSRALALIEARELGLPVVEAWVIGASTFREVLETLPPSHDPASLLRAVHRPKGLERAARARERLLSADLPEGLSDELGMLWANVGVQAKWGLTVRASATCADDGMARAAGLGRVVYGVRSLAELLQALRDVWASAVHHDSLSYLRARRQRDLAMAVIIHAEEPVAASGTLLVRGHARADGPSPQLITACLGLSGEAHDTLRIAPDGKLLERRLAVKDQRLVVGEQGPTLQAVAVARARRPALRARALAELGSIAATVQTEAEGSRARDVGFVVLRKGSVRVVSLERAARTGEPEDGDARTVWSRAALDEIMPGVPTPLSWSLVEDLGEVGLRKALAMQGIKPSSSAALIRRVRGHVYCNLSELVPELADIAGVDREMLLELVRGEGAASLKQLAEGGGSRPSLARLGLMAARLSSQQQRLAERVQRYERVGEQQNRWLREMDLGILPDDSLVTTLRETRALLDSTGQLMLSCSLTALVAHVGLKTVLARSTPVAAERIAQAISAGVGDLATLEPAVALAHVAAIVERQPAVREALLVGGIERVVDLPPGPGRRALLQLLDAYGDRGFAEWDPSLARWGEQPEPLLSMVVARLDAGVADIDEILSHARVNSDRELATVEARVPYLENAVVHSLVRGVRGSLRLRERMRAWLGRTLTLLRVVVLDIDRRLRRLDPTLPVGAAFFCTYDELISAVRRMRADLGPIVRMRMASHQRDLSLPAPPETFEGAPPLVDVPPFESAVLRGWVAGGGAATGPVRRVGPLGEHARAVGPGDILVVRHLDLGLTPLLATAAGVVAGAGGPLSHGAVVSRELGVPAVVGVPDVFTTLRDGEPLRIDGDRGVVERLDP